MNGSEASQAPLVDPVDDHADALLTLCKASGDPLRLDILRVLAHDSYGVLELCTLFDSKQSGMSHHLKILANAHLVSTRREGNSIFYRRAHRAADDPLTELQQALFRTIDTCELAAAYQQRIARIQAERAACSQAFFNENADRFSQQQEQIAAYDLYGPHTIDLLRHSFTGRRDTVLELGPGEGLFLAELSPHFEQVIALDNSAQMLEKSTAFAESRGLDNIRFIHGDTKSDQLQGMQVDCIVINMVLHHTPSPADIFSDLGSVIRSGGHLYVTELCHHDQDWAKQSCGDVWLGFEPEDLTEWAEQAGFTTGENIFLAQRNGFRVQIRQFIRM